ncbi:hypothetical protein SEVIR_5G151501v4 [Setaria viridis]
MREDRHLPNGGEATGVDLRRSRSWAPAPPKHATAVRRDARYLPKSGEATGVDLGRSRSGTAAPAEPAPAARRDAADTAEQAARVATRDARRSMDATMDPDGGEWGLSRLEEGGRAEDLRGARGVWRRGLTLTLSHGCSDTN